MIKEFDTFSVNGKEYEARKIVCDVVVAVMLNAPSIEFGIFTVPELIEVRAFN